MVDRLIKFCVSFSIWDSRFSTIAYFTDKDRGDVFLRREQRLSDESSKITFETIATPAELENMSLLVTSTGHDGVPRTLFVSRQIERLLGLNAEEICAHTFSVYIAEDVRPGLLAAREERLKAEPRPAFHEKVVVTSDSSQ
jgi:PAS domain-containing protein